MAAFAAGARVRVKDDWPETRGPVHIRTPHYLRGMRGTVVRGLGAFPNPEDLAFARPAEPRRCTMWRSISPRCGRRARRATSCWWKSTNIGWSRHDGRSPAGGSGFRPDHEHPGNRQREAAGRGARPARGEGHRLQRGNRRADRDHRCRQSGPGRAHGGEGVDRSGVSRADAGGRHQGGRGTRHPDARLAAAWACWRTPPRCTTSWSARCAAAIRARCSAIRRSGSNPPPIARAACATRAD